MEISKIVTIIKEYNEYNYYDGDRVVGKSAVEKIIETPILREWKQLISFNIEGKHEIIIELFGKYEKTIVKRLNWVNFTNDELMEFGSLFKLRINEAVTIKKEGKKDYLFATINLDENTHFVAELAIKRIVGSDKYAVVIFNFNDGESRKSPQLYVHRILEVEVANRFEKKLYGKN